MSTKSARKRARPSNYHERDRTRRGRGEGSIYQRKDGTWCAQVSLGYDSDGKRIRPTVYGATKEEVLLKVEQLRRDHREGRPIKPSSLTVGDHFTDWLRTKRPPNTASATYIKYRRFVVNHIIPHLGHVRLSDLDHRLINLFYEKLDTTLSRSTVAGIASVLRMGLNDAERKKIIRSNPALVAEARTPGTKEARYLTQDEMSAFLLAARGERLEDAFIFALHTGLRPGELFGLPWSNVDIGRRQITVNQALHEEDGDLFIGDVKSPSSRRTISISSVALAALQRQRQRQAQERLQAKGNWKNEHNLVFTNTQGGFLRRTNVVRRDLRRILRRAALVQLSRRCGLDPEAVLAAYIEGGEGPVRAGQEIIIDNGLYIVEQSDLLDGVVLHTFRHTHASILIYMGVDIKTISRRLGHKNIQITLDTYGHILPGQDERAAAAMDRFDAKLEDMAEAATTAENLPPDVIGSTLAVNVDLPTHLQ